MRITNKISRRVLTAAACMMLAAVGITSDASAAEQSAGYVYNDKGEVFRTPDGDCLRTIDWSFKNAVWECDMDAVALGLNAASTETANMNVNLATSYRTKTTTLQGGQEFGFDNDKLSRAARRTLDLIGRLHSQVLLKRIDVIAHTDRLGDATYNKDLSTRRGNAVKAYLMTKDVPETIINVIGVGESDPSVFCEGMKGDALKYCLAPNRRTEVVYQVPYIRGALLFDLRERRSTDTEVGIKSTKNVFDVSGELNRRWSEVGNACRPEMQEMCSAAGTGNGLLSACLYKNYSALSLGCKGKLNDTQHYVRSTIAKAKNIGNSCGTDIAVICKDVEIGAGGILACLVENKTSLASDCKQVLTSYDIVH